MKLLIDLFTTDYGLMSITGLFIHSQRRNM